MKEIKMEQINETLYYEKMANGLDVYILPKKGFHKTYATFTTKYGSIDNRFTPIGSSEMLHAPDGIAHFLEHKLFEKEDGDVFQDFSKNGASANAFTSFTRTAYLFSSTTNVSENLELLLDFVQRPYFTEQTVEKEKGIIGQEITMYDDNPDWRAYFGIIENLFVNHPVKIDIAGTIDSIANITKDLLYTCYETFYHPSNMLLFIVGPVDPYEKMEQVRSNQAKKQFKEATEIKRFFEEEPITVAKKSEVIRMAVQTPKCLVGIKTKNPTKSGRELLKYELTLNVALDMLFGKSSTNHEKLYNDGLIDDTFSYDYSEEYGFGFAIVGGDTQEPEKLKEQLETMLIDGLDVLQSTELLERIRKKKIGSFLRALNSPEYIANQFTRYQFNGINMFEILQALEEITSDDIQNVARSFFDEQCMSSVIVRAN